MTSDEFAFLFFFRDTNVELEPGRLGISHGSRGMRRLLYFKKSSSYSKKKKKNAAPKGRNSHGQIQGETNMTGLKNTNPIPSQFFPLLPMVTN